MKPTKTEKKLLHYLGKAIADYNLIQKNDNVLLCLSGGKDSFTLLKLLRLLQLRTDFKFNVKALMVNPNFPGWDDSLVRTWLDKNKIDYEILDKKIYDVVMARVPDNKSHCSFCSRLRRGIIYTYARENGFTKVALGHHRDDVIESLLMSIMYSGEIRSMPPKLISQQKEFIVIRPLIYCQEQDIIKYAAEQEFPLLECKCGNVKELMRDKMKALIADLAAHNPKVPSNMLHALQAVRYTQLMDKNLFDFVGLEKLLLANV